MKKRPAAVSSTRLLRISLWANSSLHGTAVHADRRPHLRGAVTRPVDTPVAGEAIGSIHVTTPCLRFRHERLERVARRSEQRGRTILVRHDPVLLEVVRWQPYDLRGIRGPHAGAERERAHLRTGRVPFE